MRRLLALFGLVGVVAAAVAVIGSGAAASAKPTPRPATPPHVMVIVMENTDNSQVVGANSMPYMNQLSHEYASFNDSWGESGDSLPNYIELLSGSTQGVSNDCDISPALADGNETPCSNIGNGFTTQTITDQMTAAGISWNAYYQGDVSGCDQTDGGGNYAYWHNAFRYFADFGTECKSLSNFSDLNSNLNSRNPADFQFVVPDLVDDGGDSGTMSSADTWVTGELPQIMASNWYRQGGQVIITWDSGYHSGTEPGLTAADGGPFKGGHIDTVVVSGATRNYGVDTTKINHAGVVNSIESVYGLPLLADAQHPDNGSLGNTLVSGRPKPTLPSNVLAGAVLNTAGRAPGSVTRVHGLALNLTGVAEPGGSNPADPNTAIEVGQGRNGEGVVVTRAHGVIPVRGTSNLEDVSCTTSTQCYAVGLAPDVADDGPLNNDQAVLVSIHDGIPGKVTPLPAFTGVYGIACPTSSTCYGVGYDNNTGHGAVTTITNGVASAPADVSQGDPWLNSISCVNSTQCYAAGLINFEPTIVPVTNGIPGTDINYTSDDYEGGIACTSVGNCLMVGENKSQEGVIMPLVNGAAGTPVNVPGTEFLYGIGCANDGNCLLTGAGTPDATTGFSSGVTDELTANGVLDTPQTIPATNGFGQTICGTSVDDCLSVGASVVSLHGPHVGFNGLPARSGESIGQGNDQHDHGKGH